jgi:hypothetical protein
MNEGAKDQGKRLKTFNRENLNQADHFKIKQDE